MEPTPNPVPAAMPPVLDANHDAPAAPRIDPDLVRAMVEAIEAGAVPQILSQIHVRHLSQGVKDEILLRADRASERAKVRWELIERVKSEIADGSYDSAQKIDWVLESLADDVIRWRPAPRQATP